MVCYFHLKSEILFKPRKIALIASLSAVMICVYPLTQVLDIFPEDVMVEIATEYTNAKRGRSFAGRFEEEEFVLDRLGDQLYFGWATYPRVPGGDIVGIESGAVGLDAWWVIKMSHSGIVGMEFVILLLAIPIWMAKKRIAAIQSDAKILMLGALMMCIVVRMADLMLNGWWNSLPVFFAGALYGICKHAHLQLDGSASLDDEPYRKREQQHEADARTD